MVQFCKLVAMASVLALTALSASASSASADACVPRIVCKDAGPWVFDSALARRGDGLREFRVKMKSPMPAVPPKFGVEMTLAQDAMHHVWTSALRSDRGLAADWEGLQKSSVAYSLPVACVYDDSGVNRMAVAASEAMRDVSFGARFREEGCLIKIDFVFFAVKEAPRTAYDVAIRMDARRVAFGEAVSDAVDWIRRENGFSVPSVPGLAFEPVYSTWYQFHQDVTAEKIEAEAKIAASLGMKTIIVDDGWQTDDTSRGYAYCGDWEPSKMRFLDMAAHVARVKAMGLKYMMWYSVPFVGEKSANFGRFKGKYLYHEKRLGASVLDPRFPEVRRFLAETYERAQREWGLDGFKLDFIDSFRVDGTDPAIVENYAGRDIMTVPEAVNVLLREIVERLRVNNPDVLIEFRQNYIGPVVTQYGNMFRAADCPGDRQANRTRIADLRLTSGGAAVHSDMIEWNVATPVEEAAGSVISAIFGTVQYSMMLSDLPPDHLRMIAHWVKFGAEHSEALQRGSFKGYESEAGYPLVCGESAAERIFGVYGSDRVVRVADLDKTTFVLNGTGIGSLCLELPGETSFEVRDTCGGHVRRGNLAAGLNLVPVPLGGYVILVRRADRSGGGSGGHDPFVQPRP